MAISNRQRNRAAIGFPTGIQRNWAGNGVSAPLVLPKSLFFPFANGKINDRDTHHKVMGPSTLRVISGIRQDGTAFSFRHRYTDVFAKTDGNWVLMAQTQSVLA